MLGLADHTARPAPALARRPDEVLEVPGRLAAGLAIGGGRFQLGAYLGLEPAVARQAEHIMDAIALAPRHQAVTGEAGIGPQDNANLRPGGADLDDDAHDLAERASRAVDVGTPQLGRQQMAATEDVQRQIAVAAIVAVEEPALLLAVQRVVRGVAIEDAARSPDRRTVIADLVIARRLRPAQLQPVQRTLARQRRARRPPCLELAAQRRQHRIVAKLVVVDQVLVAQRNPIDPLTNQRRDLVLDLPRLTVVVKALCKPINQPDRPRCPTQQQTSRVRRQPTAVERRLMKVVAPRRLSQSQDSDAPNIREKSGLDLF